jgi:alpha-N-arabinofuranosidase
MKGQAADGLTVRLRRNGAGSPVLAEAKLDAPTSDWAEHAFQLAPSAASADAMLEVVLSGAGSIALDQVSLMADSSRASGGFRPDLLKAVAELRPPVIRWPGGCFASPYRWKDGIGPQAKRGIYPRELWDDLDVNSLGTDEFIELCRRVGAEPLLVMNIGTPQWNEDADSHDFLQDALDWVEYCNGSADTKWGKVRAANGHPEPYNVKYWEIDNETWGLGAEGYAGYVKRFAPALRAKDPSIKLLMCGSGGLGERGSGQAFNRVLIDQCAELVDYISVHHYEDPDQFAEGPARFERFLSELGRIIQGSSNPGLKAYVSEWNAQSTDARTGLYAGGLLNAFERVGDVVEIGGPALFLRHVSATGWDNAFINFDHTAWFPAPNYVVMKLWRDHYQPRRVAAEGDTGVLNGVATASADGRTVVYKLVNPTDRPAPVALTVAGTPAVKSAALAVVASGETSARNTLEDRTAVRVEPGSAMVSGQVVSFVAPPLSALCVTIERE